MAAESDQLTKLEKETVILFNEAEASATVYTYNANLKKKLEDLAGKLPGQVLLLHRDAQGGVSYALPKGCISFRPPYSEERRQADRDRALQAGRRPPADRRPDP